MEHQLKLAYIIHAQFGNVEVEKESENTVAVHFSFDRRTGTLPKDSALTWFSLDGNPAKQCVETRPREMMGAIEHVWMTLVF
jgi:hypothetical protein